MSPKVKSVGSGVARRWSGLSSVADVLLRCREPALRATIELMQCNMIGAKKRKTAARRSLRNPIRRFDQAAAIAATFLFDPR